MRLLIIRDRAYPDTLVLEYGVDRVGDMAYLHTIAQPQIGILTAVAEEHLEYLGSVEGVFAEEKQIVTRLPKTEKAIVNFDDGYARGLLETVKAPVISYGLGAGAMVHAEQLSIAGLDREYCSTQYEWECIEWGTQFKVSYQGSTVPVFLPHVAGEQHVYAALAGIAAGIAIGMNLVEIADALRSYAPAPGRMRLLMGIKHTLLIDDTYNSSPRAADAAVRMLSQLPLQHDTARRWAVLGDMRELGSQSADAHRALGFLVVEQGVDQLVTVGPESKLTAQAALEAGMDGTRVVSFDTASEAGLYVQQRMAEGDIVLIKGSQGVRLEKVVKEIMADPARASELLPRQGGEWEDV